jgi:putative FmdB family regulatory protein
MALRGSVSQLRYNGCSMPIYEYVCRDCQRRFETLVTAGRQPSCPGCESQTLDKQFSVFAVAARSDAGPELGPAPGSCGTCGDPRGPGSCSLD